MRRIGVYGGTFDPIHIGHLVAAAEAQYVLGLDQVLFLPAGEPPHKVTNGVTAARHRQRMVELAIKDNPAFALSTIDLDRPGPHYTADALSILRETERDAALWFVMGEDTLLDVPNWLYPERIVEHARLAVVTRPGWKVDVADLAMLDAAIPGIVRCCDFVPIPMLDIASRELRERLRGGAPSRYQVREEVWAYIEEHGLYRSSEFGVRSSE
jgi:nicotinate-nucleotide adenylyltransferase